MFYYSTLPRVQFQVKFDKLSTDISFLALRWIYIIVIAWNIIGINISF